MKLECARILDVDGTEWIEFMGSGTKRAWGRPLWAEPIEAEVLQEMWLVFIKGAH